jgi:hypothetical protein
VGSRACDPFRTDSSLSRILIPGWGGGGMKELVLHGGEGAAVVSGGELATALGVEVRVGGLCGGFVTD